VKILIITPYPVLPLSHGGRVRTYRLATGLARAGATVDVLCPWYPGMPLRRFHRDGLTCHPHGFASNALPFILRGRLVPSLVALSCQPFALGPRRRLHAFADYDVVQFHFCAYASWMVRAPRGAQVSYVAHNVEYDYLRAQPRSIFRDYMLRRVAELERRAVRASDLVVTCTEADAGRLAQLYGEGPEYVIVPNGFDHELLDFERGRLRDAARTSLRIAPDDLALLFVGGPAPHNRQAVRFLERELIPQLGRHARLLIAGQCGDGLGEWSGDDRTVQRLGYVQDLRPAFAAADVAVNPVTYGSGSSLKMAEYLAAGLPIVTTPLGMRGFESLHDHLTVAELSQFAATIRALEPRPPAGKPQLAEFSWSALGMGLHRAHARLLARAGDARREMA